MALIKERLGHFAASHSKQFFILPGFFAFSLNFVGVKNDPGISALVIKVYVCRFITQNLADPQYTANQS
jgi:hypothetical protein